jgi:hypothetical protein
LVAAAAGSADAASTAGAAAGGKGSTTAPSGVEAAVGPAAERDCSAQSTRSKPSETPGATTWNPSGSNSRPQARQ